MFPLSFKFSEDVHPGKHGPEPFSITQIIVAEGFFYLVALFICSFALLICIILQIFKNYSRKIVPNYQMMVKFCAKLSHFGLLFFDLFFCLLLNFSLRFSWVLANFTNIFSYLSDFYQTFLFSIFQLFFWNLDTVHLAWTQPQLVYTRWSRL